MCGIAGFVEQGSIAEKLVAKGEAMMKVLHHRGPDGGDIWLDDDHALVLSHRRLAIQDLSNCGKQPMLSASRRYCIVFNGEMYNFKEVASDLGKLGHMFVGNSDTEVLLAAIEEWGLEEAVNCFKGMFAFALWDKKSKSLQLCRDRLGEKPLYYGWLGDAFYFASELKAIEEVVEKAQLEINSSAVSDFLKNGYISAPYSIYKHLYKLMPGTILTITVLNSESKHLHSPLPDTVLISPKTYWSVYDSANKGLSSLIQSEDEVIEQLDSTLHQSVRRQMIADVKVGTFLSGGIDSTLVSAIAQYESSDKIRTYTIGFSEKEYDESVYAGKIARHLGTDHLTVRVSPIDALNVVPDLASIYDEPFADSSQIPSYLVSKLAHEHVTVCLSGDGGDELFAGYNRYQLAQSLWSKLSKIPYPLRLLVGRLLNIPATGMWDSAYHGLSELNLSGHEKQKLVGLKVQKLAGFMQQKDIFQAYDFLMSYWNHPENLVTSGVKNERYGAHLSLPSTDSFIEQAMYLDQMQYLPGDNLTKVDRASMAVGLETRLPLLSHEIVDLSWRVPTSMKIKNGVAKWVLREVLYKYVPREMMDRPKMGFSVPVAAWLRSDLKSWAEDLLNSLDAADHVLQKEAILNTWHEHVSGKRDHSHRLWAVLMFLSWFQSRSL